MDQIVYVLIEKRLVDEFVTVTGVYEDYDTAYEVMDKLMGVYEEEVAYKIVTRVVIQSATLSKS